jgi:hypothetical protein
MSHPSRPTAPPTSRLALPIAFAILVLGGRLAALEETEQKTDAPWRESMAARWNEVRAFHTRNGAEHEVDRVAEPVFSYVERAREGQHVGTLWLWGTQGRPVALFAQNRDLTDPSVGGFELVALTDGVSAVMHDGWKWSPPSSALNMKSFPDVPAAAETEAGRLVQFKALARRFDVSEKLGDEQSPLRLLPTPVYRYQDPGPGMVDGALFILGHGTNPEAVLVIECRTQNGGASWSYGFVPLAAAAVTARLNEQIVWEKESTPGPKRQDAYSTWLETGLN